MLPLVLLGFYPVLNYIALPFIFLLLASDEIINNPKLSRATFVYFIIILAFTNASIFASRSVFINYNDDFSNIYWNQFLELKVESFDFIFSSRRDETYTNEYGYYTLIWLLSKFIPNLSPSGFLFITVLINSLIIYKAIGILMDINQFPKSKIYLLLFISTTFISYGLMTQLIRQYYSISFLLLFLSKPTSRRIYLIVIAFLFHQTVLVPLFLFFAVKHTRFKHYLYLGICGIIIYYNLDFFLTYVSSLSYVKLSFYTEFKFSEDAFDYNYIFIPFFIYFTIIASWGIFTNRLFVWNKYLLSGMFLYIIFINVPLLAVRINLIFFALLIGFYLSANILYKFDKYLIFMAALLGGVLIFYKNVYLIERGNDRLWYSYDPINHIPFEYFQHYFQ